MFGAWRSARLSYAPELCDCLSAYTTSRHRRPNGGLFGLAVLRMLPVSWTELLQHEPIGVVAFVFFGVIVALFTFGTGQRNEHSICFLRHRLTSFAVSKKEDKA